MNKILNINLGGYALTIDDDAYQYIGAYLDNIRRRFSESDGRDEIMRDVESRMGELITNDLGKRTIVMLPDVETAINIMGKPEDFGGEPSSSSSSSNSSTGAGRPAIRTGKQLFRDEEDAVIAGVCSGLAAYFGMAQPVWMRVIFVLLALLSAGFWVPVYLLLWVIVNPARSSSERLAMRGEAVNVDNIAREFEQGFERMGKGLNKMGDQLSGVKRPIGQVANAASNGCITVFGKLIMGVLIIIAAFMVMGLGTAWVGSIWAFVVASPFINYASPLSEGWTFIAFLCFFCVLGLPVISLSLWLADITFKLKTPSWLKTTMGLAWVVSFIGLLFLSVFGASGYSQSASIPDPIDLSGIRSDTLRVEWLNDQTDGEGWLFHEDGIRVNTDNIDINNMIDIRVMKSTGNRFEGTKILTARGENQLEATENANSVQFATELRGNTLLIPSHYKIANGKKWRANTVKINLNIPIGKYIVFGPGVNNFGHSIEVRRNGNDYTHIGWEENKVFRMTEDGLVCADCPAVGDRDYRNNDAFEKFVLEGNFTVEILKSDEDFGFEIEGDKNGIKSIPMDRTLTLTTDGKTLSKPTKVIIRTNEFTKLYGANTGEITIRGFDLNEASITAKGSTTIKGLFDCNRLDLTLTGPASAELIGDGDYLEATLTDGAVLKAVSWKTREAHISAADASEARIHARDRAVVKAAPTSNVKVEGGARIDEEE